MAIYAIKILVNLDVIRITSAPLNVIGTCFVTEKIDGANTSIWMDGDKLCTASRSQPVEGGFNGFVDYVHAHEGIKKLLQNHPQVRLYGEFLVRHSISYNETAYKQFYLFDIEIDDKFIPLEQVYAFAEQYGIKTAALFAKLENPTEEQIKEYVGKTVLGDKGEGVVIKNFDFVNSFGELTYAKVTTEDFKELNMLTFGGNNKHAESYNEMYVVNKYMTIERVRKIMHKIEPLVEGGLGKKDTPRIASTAYHDLLTEEIYAIAKKVPTLNFKTLKSLITRKAIKMFHDILDNHISVAYGYETTENNNAPGSARRWEKFLGEGASTEESGQDQTSF